MTLAKLMVVLGIDTRIFNSGLTQAMAQIRAFQGSVGALTSGQALSSLGRGLTYGLTIPILAAAAAIGVAGTQLTSEMARIQSVIATPGNSGSAQIAQWTNQVQALGVELGRTSPELAGGLYEIVSAFGNLSNASEFLRIAGRAAVAGQSDITTSTKNLVLATRAWGDSSTEAVQRMADLASATVRVGTLTESELGPALAGLLPISRLYGVRLEENFAALASLAGVSGSASQASTQLQRAITSLVAPNTTLARLYKANGIESGKLLIEQMGLVGAFKEVVRMSEATHTPLQKMLGRVEGLKAIATLTGPQLKSFTDNLEAMSNAAGSVDTAFAGATGGISKVEFEWKQALQRLRIIGEDLYIAFGPAALNVANSLAPIGRGLEGVAQAVAQMDTGTLTTVLYILLGLAALGPVVSVIGGLVSAFSGLSGVLAAANPWVLAVAVAGGALWAAWNQDWGGIQGGVFALMDTIQRRADNTRQAIENLQKAWDAFRNPQAASGTNGPAATLRDVAKAAGEVFTALGPAKSELSHFEQQMVNSAPKAQTAWSMFWGGFKDNWPDFSQLGADISGLWSSITSGAAGAGAGISSGITPAISAIGPALKTMSSTATSEMLKIPQTAKGSAASTKAAFTGVGWGNVGSSIVSGIAAGIRSGLSSIVSAAKAVASAAYTAAMSALQANSPSRLMMGPGLYAAQGLAVGMLNGVRYVQSAATQMIAPLTNLALGNGYGFDLAGAGAAGGTTHNSEVSYGDIIVNVMAGDAATGKEIGVSITGALQRRGLL